jgi:HK97 family phage prohead protease
MNRDVQDFASIVTEDKSIGQEGPEHKELSGLFVKSIDLKKRQIRVLASSADLDADSERILPQGIKLERFLANPVILAAHKHRLDDGRPPVIGKAAKVWVDKVGLWVIIEFAKTALAEEYWQLYRDGYMKAVSIGFIDIRGHNVIESDGRHVRIWDETELLELSCVAIGSNPEALVRSKQNFVQGKREQRERAALLRSLGKTEEQFGQDCLEYAEALMDPDFKGCGRADNEEEGDEYDEGDGYFDIIAEKQSQGDEPDFAAMMARDEYHEKSCSGPFVPESRSLAYYGCWE